MKQRHLVEEIAALIREIHSKCPIAKDYSLKSHPKELLSEALEVKEAAEKHDWENLKEELGDVLWDWLTLCCIAEKKACLRCKMFSSNFAKKFCAETHTYSATPRFQAKKRPKKYG